jgi:hypothetical protein
VARTGTRRFVLDTNLFRGLDSPALDSLAATADKLGFKLSISETALTETWARSVSDYRNGVARAKARGLLFTRVQKVAPYVDPQYPVAVTGGFGVTRVRSVASEESTVRDKIAGSARS